jgi:UDP-hydrolysing UDP-N-acetyl-D-glucosamine 2-epimerase
MTSVLFAIEKSPKLVLQMYATGMHLMPEFGNTIEEVKRSFPMVQEIHAVIKTDTSEALACYFSDCIRDVILTFAQNRPDMALVLGDRAEMLAVASACLYLGIPVAHIHGGDVSSTVDEVTRHTITKLSHIHFPATKEAALRIRNMREESWRIHTMGSPSLDTILAKQCVSDDDVFRFLHIPKSQKYILVTLHPETSSFSQNRKNIREVLSAVRRFEMPIVIVYPNADPGNSVIIEEIEKNRKDPLFRIFKSILYDLFIGVEKNANVWVGNSSAGIIESPSFHVPVVNIGTRQEGRTKAKNVIDVPFRKMDIADAIRRSLTDSDFLRMIAKIKNPWGNGHTASRVVKILETVEINQKLLMKKFVDV